MKFALERALEQQLAKVNCCLRILRDRERKININNATVCVRSCAACILLLWDVSCHLRGWIGQILPTMAGSLRDLIIIAHHRQWHRSGAGMQENHDGSSKVVLPLAALVVLQLPALADFHAY